MKSLKFKRKNAVKKVIMVCTIIISMALCEVEPVLAEEYTYDKYNRLIEVVYDDGSSVTYTYDLNGNITSVTVVDP